MVLGYLEILVSSEQWSLLRMELLDLLTPTRLRRLWAKGVRLFGRSLFSLADQARGGPKCICCLNHLANSTRQFVGNRTYIYAFLPCTGLDPGSPPPPPPPGGRNAGFQIWRSKFVCRLNHSATGRHIYTTHRISSRVGNRHSPNEDICLWFMWKSVQKSSLVTCKSIVTWHDNIYASS